MSRKEFFVAIVGGSVAGIAAKGTVREWPFAVPPNTVRELEKGTYSINQVRAFYGLRPLPEGDAHKVELFAKHYAV